MQHSVAFRASQPLVTIILPVKNGEAYLDAALASLAAQTYRDFEILLIDNGSDDSTPDIIRRWQEREPRVKAMHWPDLFLGDCLRHAADMVATPFLARLDADDLAHPARLERQLATMHGPTAPVLVGTNATLIDSSGRAIGSIRNPAKHEELLDALRLRCPFIHSSVMMRTDAYRASGGYRPGLNMSEDYDLWSRLAEIGGVENLAEPLTCYRIHPASITMRQPLRMALTALCVAAARDARLAGRPEPFIRGVPNLRAAGALLGLSRTELRRLMRIRVLRHRISRQFLMLPLPQKLKSAMRECAHRFGPRGLYLKLIDTMTSPRGRQSATLSEQTR